MRLIKDMVRVLLKLLFNIDTDLPVAEQVSEEALRNYESLTDMIDDGKINEAENQIYEMIEDRRKEDLQTALLVFNYLNNLNDSFLEEHNFSRNEVTEDLKDIAAKYGIDSEMVRTFLME